FAHGATRFSFTLTNNSGGWTSALDVLAPSAAGYAAAIHAFVCAAATCGPSSGALATGFAVDAGPYTPSSGPVPLTLPLLLPGLGLVGIASRRKRQRQPG